MLVTLAIAVPLPLLTVQVCVVGCVNTVATYVVPLLIALLNVKLPLAATVRSFPALFCNTTLPFNPLTVPPMIKVAIVMELELELDVELEIELELELEIELEVEFELEVELEFELELELVELEVELELEMEMEAELELEGAENVDELLPPPPPPHAYSKDTNVASVTLRVMYIILFIVVAPPVIVNPVLLTDQEVHRCSE